jgi:hypothetical protein
MSLFIRRFMVLLLAIGLGISTVSARAQSERTDLSGNYSVIVPEGWTKGEVNDQGTVFTNGDATLTIFDPDQMAGLMSDFSGSDLKELLVVVFDQTHDFQAEQQAVKNGKFNGNDAAIWNYPIPDEPDTQAAFIVFKLAGENYGALDITSPQGVFGDSLNAGRELVSSLSSGEPVVAAGGECSVSTETERSAALRVGPGENRSSVAFLPAGQNFVVLGQSTDKSDKVWFKLDKAEAAPKSSANEVWVLSDTVSTSGNCDAVADAAAPPIVPIVAAPPPSTGGNTGDGNTGDNPASGGGTVPKTGTWTISYAATAPGSCLNQPGVTIQIPINIPPDTTRVSNATESSLILGGDSFTTIQPGVYQGLYTGVVGIDTVVLTLRVINDSVMTTEFIFNVTVEGTRCSITVNGTATRNS